MKNLTVALLIIVAAGVLHAQSQPGTTSEMHLGPGANNLSTSADLPEEPIGSNDLIGITVYDSPELTRTVRVDSDGTIRLPMLEKHIQAAGLRPEDLEKAIAKALIEGQVLVDPIVTVTVVEYLSRPINVVGAVRTPVTFQDTGDITLLDAISRAGGLADNAGPDILVSRQEQTSNGKSTTLTQRISAHGLIDAVDPSLNLRLQGGEVVRVPEAGLVYVIGNVKTPGAYPIRGNSGTSVLKLMALTQGMNSFTAKTAYIYRNEGGSGGNGQIPIELKKIIEHKSPDVPLMANDILYVPEANGRKATYRALAVAGGIGIALGTTLLYLYH